MYETEHKTEYETEINQLRTIKDIKSKKKKIRRTMDSLIRNALTGHGCLGFVPGSPCRARPSTQRSSTSLGPQSSFVPR